MSDVLVRATEERDFPGIIEITREVYPWSLPYGQEQLASQRRQFPEGQLVAVDAAERVLGMAASLIVRWDDYESDLDWHDFTDSGYFTNHDPEVGRTLYGAEVMVRPSAQGRGIGRRLYASRRELVRRLGLLRIRAGARLRGYRHWAGELAPEEYVRRVVRGEIGDRTLSFQLSEGFRVIGVVAGYLAHDPESLGHAAVIEWLNPEVAGEEDRRRQERAFPLDGAAGG